ncbi:MAG: fumarate reductase/succinate dehydrogenase flavoprotein subunit, partial [Longimicrobiales bacterium]|nr:fumarate reductase/succinate dehydrogenase flavoprotein subunit [Longimicrobiales bacterium]
MAEYRTVEHDVLVIGAGGAGLRAAVEAAKDARVGLVCKSLLGKAHTVMAEGGIAASLANVDERDNWRVHFADTMRGGAYLNNWRMAELHAREAPDRVRELEAWGALMDRTPDGKILQRNFGGHAYPRLAHVGDRTGLEMIRTLQDHGIHQGLDVHMEVTVTALLKDGDRVAGALGYDRERGRFTVFRAGAVVMATGGIGKAYKITSNSWEYTGDGHALAYHAGAELIDMEFLQFHPTGMVWPPSVQGILVTEGVRGEGGILKNSEGRRFMFDDIPPLYQDQTADTPEEGWRYVTGDRQARRPPELLTRDHVARCILREVREGRGSPHGGVFLDIAWIDEKVPDGPAHIKRKLPGMYHQFKELAGIDITKEPMEVGPTTHYVMGGIRVDADSQMSTVPGLFAAGECAAGLHGANRLGGNSLSDLLVFGRRAGQYASEFANDKGLPTIDEGEVKKAIRDALAPLERPASDDDVGPYRVLHSIQELMQDKAGIIRDEEHLGAALEGLERIRPQVDGISVGGNREFNPGWHAALDLANIMTVSEALVRAARERKESRGAHSRTDYTEKDKE